MRHLQRWAAVWILVGLFLGSWAGQLLTQAVEFANSAKDHGQSARWADFWPEFWAATFENWQSEFLQLAVQAVLIASVLSKKTFAADHGADKDDVERILRAIESRS